MPLVARSLRHLVRLGFGSARSSAIITRKTSRRLTPVNCPCLSPFWNDCRLPVPTSRPRSRHSRGLSRKLWIVLLPACTSSIQPPRSVAFPSAASSLNEGHCGVILRSTGRAGTRLRSGERQRGAPVTSNVERPLRSNSTIVWLLSAALPSGCSWPKVAILQRLIESMAADPHHRTSPAT